MCVGENLMCRIEMSQPKTNKLSQYLETCVCCRSGHLSNPLCKLLCDVALWVSAQGLI